MFFFIVIHVHAYCQAKMCRNPLQSHLSLIKRLSILRISKFSHYLMFNRTQFKTIIFIRLFIKSHPLSMCYRI